MFARTIPADCQVTVVEFLDRITPGIDNEVAKDFQRILKKQGIDFKLGTKVCLPRADGAARAARGGTLCVARTPPRQLAHWPRTEPAPGTSTRLLRALQSLHKPAHGPSHLTQPRHAGHLRHREARWWRHARGGAG
eukprot:scaffold23059_cov31-Tisochrysis_lutea.AAC.3